jgi:Holliday junction DNA helicase RuvA
MYEYIRGEITESTPAYIILDNQGIGYFINISLYTYNQLINDTKSNNQSVKLYIHEVIREDAHLLYGFYNNTEREIFKLLLTVSGIGANTTRVILSSLTPDELKQAVVAGNVETLKGIKGIGAKSAQRIIVDLKDKITKENVVAEEIMVSQNNTIKDEAFSALITLGFSKNNIDKVINVILSENQNIPVEDLVKEALKRL